jgi:hypothetical protein
MNLTDIWATAGAVIVSLGGGGVIVLGFSSYIGKLLGDRYVEKVKHELQQEIESHKTRLKKSEFLFQKEFEAASEFVALRRRFFPKYRFRDMDWGDACEDFAYDFEKVEAALDAYIAEHGAALSKKVLDQISDALSEAGAGKFEVRRDEVSSAGVKAAGKVLEALEKIEHELRETVWAQSGT